MFNNDIYDDFHKYATDGNKVIQNKSNASVWCIVVGVHDYIPEFNLSLYCINLLLKKIWLPTTENSIDIRHVGTLCQQIIRPNFEFH